MEIRSRILGDTRSDGYIQADELACIVFRAATGIDVKLSALALVLRNSEGWQLSDGSQLPDLPTLIGLKGAKAEWLATQPAHDDSDLRHLWNGVREWNHAIARAAQDESWPRLRYVSLAPIPADDSTDSFLIEIRRALDWLKRTAPQVLSDAVARELGNRCDRNEIDSNESRQVEKRRRAFTRAVFAALEIVAEKPGEKTRDAVFAYFAAGEDKTGAIVSTEPGYKIRWQAGKGEIKVADKDSLDTAIEEYRREKISRRKE